MEGYSHYKEVEIETASGLKLVVMLYAGAIKFLNIANDAINENKLDIANNNITKAQDIVAELMSSLNFDAGEIAQNLYSLYIYINRRLLEANLEKNPEIINEVTGLLNSLKGAWEELLKNENQKNQSTGPMTGLNISG